MTRESQATYRNGSVGLAAGAVGLIALMAALAPSPAAAQIAGTKHNLTSTSTAPNHLNVTGVEDICVFCHTPHGSNTGVVAPLWNKPVGVSSSYTTYSDTGGGTLDGTPLTVGSVSLACLSCHDGTIAMDTVINAPGSGGFNPLGARITTSATGWTGPSVDAATGRLLSTAVSNLGQDLSNDHPIGVPYGGGVGSAANSLRDPDFRTVSSGTIGGATRYWVDTPGFGAGGQRDKTDMILYNRNDAGAVTNIGYVECGSCHDPHVDTAPTGAGMFLRVANAASAVCLACHVK